MTLRKPSSRWTSRLERAVGTLAALSGLGLVALPRVTVAQTAPAPAPVTTTVRRVSTAPGSAPDPAAAPSSTVRSTSTTSLTPAPPAAPPPATAPPMAPGPAATTAPTRDLGWPRQLEKDGALLVYYQPELDAWKDYRDLTCRIAFSLTPKGEKPVLGVATLAANTIVDRDARTVFLRDVAVKGVRFPSESPERSKKLGELVTSMIPAGGEPIALDRVLAMVERDKAPARTAPVKNDPPPIIVSAKPALVLFIDGEPALAPIEQTGLDFVVNANWDVFFDKASRAYFLLATDVWLTSSDLRGPWTATQKLPADFAKLPVGPDFDDVRKRVPAPAKKGPVPEVYSSRVPSELVVLKGAPAYAKIPGTALRYVSNTESDLFVFDVDQAFYLLLSGRWFRSPSLHGPWSFASANLPADFAKIPPTSPKASVRVFVPGTEEAADAVLLAQIPTSAVVDKAQAAALVKVLYDGPPQFVAIAGTELQYATNTDQQVIKLGGVYYVCFQGVWFRSLSPTGPWETADTIPSAIYTIPPSSPVYNVTYVTHTNATPTTVESSYTSGYYGQFVVSVGIGLAIGYGTGWYYPPYYYRPPGYYYPIYRPCPPTYGVGAVYNPQTGAFGVGRAVYGPYGAAGGAAFYNPQTGRYGRAASVQGAYGGRTVAASYNPRTGGYARTSQSHNAYAQWGSSVATRGSDWVKTGHVTTAGGTAAAYRTSSGKSGVVARGANGTAVRTDNGMYAGKDGNVYKRNGRGDWSQYENGGFQQVDRASQRSQELERSANARTRGQANAQRNAAPAPRPSGGTGGGGGRRGGGGGRRR